MCYASDSAIYVLREDAKTRPAANDTPCPECGLPLSGHITAEESGYTFLHGDPNTVIKQGDVLLDFSDEEDASFFSARPFYRKPGEGPEAEVIIPNGFISKTILDVSMFLTNDDRETALEDKDYLKLVVMRPNLTARVAPPEQATTG